MNKMFDSTCSIVFIILLLNPSIHSKYSSKCSRTPEGRGSLQMPADGRFRIRILENVDKYTPGKTYTIKLEGFDTGHRTIPPLKYKFSGFMLVVVNESNQSLGDYSTSSVGTLTLSPGDAFTKISCENMVAHTTTASKSEIQVLWTAPKSGSGCVSFKATVIEHRHVWYMDDGPLTKEFCEEQNFVDDEPVQCCACTEAQYELAFEGFWSRNTHPKDFPSSNFATKFSDIIGASHASSYSLWKYGQIASYAVMQVAEHGSTTELESELMSNRVAVRTIVKAKGVVNPEIGSTFAVFRVDQNHSQLSFISKIDPSPDWFVGVSGLELCTKDCGWIESRIIDLFPWDAGTDSGPSYVSPNAPTSPREFVRPIRSDSRNDPRSPFYDPTSNLKPLARLHVSRRKLNGTNCSAETGDGVSSVSTGACDLGPWRQLSECDAQCGPGHIHEEREYLDEHLAGRAGCRDNLARQIPCYGRNCGYDDQKCIPSKWSPYGACSVTCGGGVKIRTRTTLTGKCEKSDLIEQIECGMNDCVVPGYCKEEPVRGNCRHVTNMWFYNWKAKRCDMFGWSCGKHRNRFATFEDCWKTCSEQSQRRMLETDDLCLYVDD